MKGMCEAPASVRGYERSEVMKDLAVTKDESGVWCSKAESSFEPLGGEWMFKITQALAGGSSHCPG